MRERILVTGGAGYIGSHLTDKLLQKDKEVIVIDNLSTGRIKNIEDNFKNPNFYFINDTILNEPLMEKLIERVNVVYHLAAVVGVKHIVKDSLQAILTNVTGTEIVLRLAYKYWRKVIITSSSEVYGKSQDIPFKEDGDRLLGSTNIDRWSYSTSKAIDEHIAFAYAKKGLKVVVLRYFNSYGPRIDEMGYGTVVARFIGQALKGQPITVHGDGQQTRCFTYIDDTIEGTILAGEIEEACGEVFNIGSTEEVSIFSLAELIKELTSSKSEIIFVPYESYYGPYYEDTRRRIPDISKAKRILNFNPKVKLKEGLEYTIEWWKKNYTQR